MDTGGSGREVVGVLKVLEGDSMDYTGPGKVVWVLKVLEGSYELKGS